MRKGRFSKFVIVFVIALNVIFTGAVFYVFLKTGGSEPQVLIGSWFAFTTTELWNLARIKQTKIGKDGKE